MSLPLWLIIVTGLILYFVVPLIIWIFGKHNRSSNIIAIILLLLYSVVLYIGVTSRINIGKIVTIEFDYSSDWINKAINFNVLKLDWIDAVINLLMLIPIGLFVIYFSKKKFACNIAILLLTGLLVGILIESLQFILPVYRSVQLSDVLLNSVSVFLGGMIGYLYKLIAIKIKK